MTTDEKPITLEALQQALIASAISESEYDVLKQDLAAFPAHSASADQLSRLMCSVIAQKISIFIYERLRNDLVASLRVGHGDAASSATSPSNEIISDSGLGTASVEETGASGNRDASLAENDVTIAPSEQPPAIPEQVPEVSNLTASIDEGSAMRRKFLEVSLANTHTIRASEIFGQFLIASAACVAGFALLWGIGLVPDETLDELVTLYLRKVPTAIMKTPIGRDTFSLVCEIFYYLGPLAIFPMLWFALSVSEVTTALSVRKMLQNKSLFSYNNVDKYNKLDEAIKYRVIACLMQNDNDRKGHLKFEDRSQEIANEVADTFAARERIEHGFIGAFCIVNFMLASVHCSWPDWPWVLRWEWLYHLTCVVWMLASISMALKLRGEMESDDETYISEAEISRATEKYGTVSIHDLLCDRDAPKRITILWKSIKVIGALIVLTIGAIFFCTVICGLLSNLMSDELAAHIGVSMVALFVICMLVAYSASLWLEFGAVKRFAAKAKDVGYPSRSV